MRGKLEELDTSAKMARLTYVFPTIKLTCHFHPGALQIRSIRLTEQRRISAMSWFKIKERFPFRDQHTQTTPSAVLGR
jgi:hypothetical protein